MDLKTFVAESLKQIAEGIREAQAADTGALISPATTSTGEGPIVLDGNGLHAQQVSFDVALTATEADEQKGGGKLKVWVASIGGEVGKSTQSMTVSRVSFQVPVCWPQAKDLSQHIKPYRTGTGRVINTYDPTDF